MPVKPSPRKTSAPAHCYRCGRTGDALTVTSSTQYRNLGGNKREHADTICACGNQWWSRHPELIAKARAADRARNA